jgi:hypothetical protein
MVIYINVFLRRTIAGIANDCWFYAAIAAYTVIGVALLSALGATDRATYEPYIIRWPVLFGITMPAIALLIDVLLVLHRFNSKRGLAFRKTFSPSRLGYLVSGIALIMAMMMFQGTFTSVKNALTLFHGGTFPYDRTQADIDKAIHFGVDPWVWLNKVTGTDMIRMVVEWNYNVLWFVLCFSALFFIATSPKVAAIRGRYIACFMLVWVVLGNVIAGLFLSAGPAFYGAVTGDKIRFAEQLAFLARGAGAGSSAANYQEYLWSLHESGRVGLASGISAFPSVHVGLITLNALAISEWSRRVGVLAFAYVAFICASSVYLAWHYAIDGYVSVAVTIAIWWAAKKVETRLPKHASVTTVEERQTAPPYSFRSATSSTR